MPSVSPRTTDRRRGIPFSPRGPGGPVPPLRRSYEMLRLPTALRAALRFLRWAIPPVRPVFVPDGPGRRAVDPPGVGHPALLPAWGGGEGGFSKVPGNPSRPFALPPAPGGTGRAGGVQV